MTTNPETKRVYNQADLASLVAGDRVILSLTSEEERRQASYAYGGVSGNDVLFLSYDDSMLEILKVKQEGLSLDGLGNLVVTELEDMELILLVESSYNITGLYEKELTLLEKAGLYTNN